VSEPTLQTQGLSKSFVSGQRRLEVLVKVDLQVEAGESVSIQGESGSGKSTLLNVIAGLDTADEGKIFWRGEEVSGLSMAQLAARRGRFLGMVFQSYYLVPELDACQNLMLGARVAKLPMDDSLRQRADSLLERVGLGDRRRQSVTTLSGGERQRIAIARAMLVSPSILLADEPTGNLDARTGDRVMDMLLQLCAEFGMSLLLVTHNRGYAKRTDRCLHLKNGHLASD